MAKGNAVQVCDFSRSFLRWRVDTLKKPPITVSRPLPMTLNNVRMPLDCRTIITDERTGWRTEIALGASCKAEQVWVDSDVWHDPNADMCMWGSNDQFVVCKQWDRLDKGVMLSPPTLGPQPVKHLGSTAEAFDSFSLAIKVIPGRELTEIDDILEALYSEHPMVSQTEYRSHGYHVLLEYPVMDVNFSERERYYQVDTGPVLLPDFENTSEPLLQGCCLAFVAHNVPEWAEFIVNVPTPLTDGIKVHHFSKSVRIEDTINRMIVVE